MPRNGKKIYKTMDSKPVLKTLYSMEAEASQIYTRKLFRMFQDELVHTQEYVADRVNVDGDSKTDGIQKPMGIQKHTRWTRNAKTNGTVDLLRDTLVKNTSESSTLWFNSVMLHSLALSEKATRSSKHYDHAICGIKNLCAELDSLAIDKKVDEDIADSKALDTKDEGNTSCNIITLRDPAHVVTKGRPPSVRKKGSLEKINKKTINRIHTLSMRLNLNLLINLRM
ncbi:FAR1-related protein [Corchorus capsularis]|uniref:FAR1-related protein n=1 Tax=Corchorus capsularis TaxID=210143 RepID=A0A1R3H026_COCAP|nr:FAR1-related protein [Corchorus capsularis]